MTESKIKTLILCGGKGTRLRPMTEDLPKALVMLGDKPNLQHIIESYISKGFKDFVICVGYQAEKIREFVGKSSFDAKIEFSDAGQDASMLQRLNAAREYMGERVFVAYGDTLVNVDLDQMIQEHLDSGAKITLTTAEIKSPFGLIKSDAKGMIESIREKPVQQFFVGHMLLERSIFPGLDAALLEMPDGQGLVALFEQLIENRQAHCHSYLGPQITFNTQQDLDLAQKKILTFFTHADTERDEL